MGCGMRHGEDITCIIPIIWGMNRWGTTGPAAGPGAGPGAGPAAGVEEEEEEEEEDGGGKRGTVGRRGGGGGCCCCCCCCCSCVLGAAVVAAMKCTPVAASCPALPSLLRRAARISSLECEAMCLERRLEVTLPRQTGHEDMGEDIFGMEGASLHPEEGEGWGRPSSLPLWWWWRRRSQSVRIGWRGEGRGGEAAAALIAVWLAPLPSLRC